MINFLPFSASKRNSLPMMSRTVKSKNEAGSCLLSPSAPDLKTSFCNRPPIRKINNIRIPNFTTYHRKICSNILINISEQFFKGSSSSNLHHNQKKLTCVLFYYMEIRNGFRRRTAFAIQDQLKDSTRIRIRGCSRGSSKGSLPKFKKTTEVSLLRGRRQDPEFLKLVEELKERKGTFFRMGFRSYERVQNRKVLGEVLGLDANRTKGTMFLGELWSNRDQARFLNENRIHMTKMKLIDKFQTIRKHQEEEVKNMSRLQIEDEMESSHSLKDLIKQPFICTLSTTRRQTNKKFRIAESLEEIKASLKDLKNNGGHSLSGQIKYLQNCQERLDKVERNYFLKMLELS